MLEVKPQPVSRPARSDSGAGLSQDNLKLIDHKIDVYRGRLAAGDADQLWAPTA